MADLNKLIREQFPNLTDCWNLEKTKLHNAKRLQQVMSLDPSAYPEYLSKLYRSKTGHELNFEEPQRFTEKIQWRKLYDQDYSYAYLSDKYQVREWVSRKIGAEFLIPLIGHWSNFDDIDFSLLPDQFVLKTNNASHTNIIVTDKSIFLKKKWAARRRMSYWLSTPFAYLEGLELHYLDIAPQIIAEEYLPPKLGETDLVDYKFHCFNGTPVLCQIINNRSKDQTIDFFNMNWNHIEMRRPPFINSTRVINKPANFELMQNLSSKLSDGFQYVRVDLYEHQGTVYFGEMTFTPASGMMLFDPDKWDKKLGELWNIKDQQVDQKKVQLLD